MRTKLLTNLSNAGEPAGIADRATHDAVHNDMLIPGICGILRIHRSRQGDRSLPRRFARVEHTAGAGDGDLVIRRRGIRPQFTRTLA